MNVNDIQCLSVFDVELYPFSKCFDLAESVLKINFLRIVI